MKGLNVPVSTQNSAVKIYNLPLVQVLHKEELGISMYEIGNLIPGQPFIEKVLMLLGATGAGKTTLINRMVNHIYGVQWDDDFRFQLISEEIAKSQTLVIIYTIYPSLESHFPYTLTIVDTPSFTDAKHDQIFQQIKEIFSNTLQGIKGIDHLDAIGFVIQSSLVSLTIEQRIFNSIVSIFGNDVANNIFMMVTFADASKPPVMTAIEEADIKFRKIFKFNNSALHVSNSSRCESHEHDFDSMFWKLGINSFNYFFESLCDVEQISLCLTKEVLRKRKHLEVAHQVQQQIDNKQHETTASQELLKLKDFPWQFLLRQVDNPPNIYSTNCVNCCYTCHDACNVAVLPNPSDHNMYDCSAMDDVGKDTAHCQRCPHKCSWRDHKWASYHYKHYIERETTASQELSKFKDFLCIKAIDDPPSQYSTNCTTCEYTCHLNCHAPDIHNCSSMNNGSKDAAHCPKKCFWSNHNQALYHHTIYIEQKTTAPQELSKFKDFPCQFFFRQVDNAPNIYSTNCSICKYTCHAECNAPDIYNCSSMDNGGEDAAHCQHCPQKCSWKHHKQSSYQYNIYKEEIPQELQRNKGLPKQVLIRKVNNQVGEYSINCLVCQHTCHRVCNATDICRCSSMDKSTRFTKAAHCDVCPQKCSWRDHKQSSYHYQIYTEEEAMYVKITILAKKVGAIGNTIQLKNLLVSLLISLLRQLLRQLAI